ncbi:signal transduction histidine kinase [Sphingomonas aerolata]|uniref:histidine kinase n=1 Tax=Sphingomonas aerolata TaxID=185951 RepID=A0A2T4YMA9_9SPHN|nr:HAMP domain-containing sensor histidine kinase [Sphingomonas aerolata]PTM44544.1 signal transduction histidine kinase [Sphingomonas aerolata]
MRLIPRSIHGRMLGLSLLATLVALVVAGAAIAGVLQRFVTQGLDQRLDAELSLLAGAVDGDGRIDRARLTRLRGLLDAGPGWQWQISGPAQTVSSAEFPTLRTPGPAPRDALRGEGKERPQPLEGRDGVHARRISIATDAGPVVLTAAAPRDVVARPIQAAVVPLLATLGILGIVLGVATLVQVRIGLRPLRALRDGVAAMRRGATSISEAQPDELRPLAIELNALARDNASALATARASAANLAHALKTPVATLALTVRDDPAQAAQLARIDATIRHHLARARNIAGGHASSTALAPAIADLVSTIRRLRMERSIVIDAAIDPALHVAVDAADLDELAGNLIDNAARHARTTVHVAARVDQGMIRLSVVDDGPGIALADRQRATDAGVRLDEREDGHGFGLAIARELAALYGGVLVLDDAAGGGLSASVTMPIGTAV